MMQSQDPDGQKNLMLAIGLSVAVLLLWQVFYGAPKLQEEQERIRRQKEVAEQTMAKPGAAPSTAPGVVPTPGGTTAAPSAAGTVTPVISRAVALEASPRASIDTEKVRGSINLKGGRLDDLVLPKYRERVELTSPPVTLMSPAETAAPFFAETGWSAAPGITAKLPDRDTVWSIAPGAKLTSKTPLVLTWDNGQGLVFKRTVALDENYMFTFTDEVENRTAADVRLYPFGRLFRETMPKVEGLIAHEGPYGAVGSDTLTEVTYYDVQKPTGQKLFENVSTGWLGFSDKYWAYVLIPDQASKFTARMWAPTRKSAITQDTFQTDYIQEPITIAAGQSKATINRLFAGAKEVSVIDGYHAALGIRQFDNVVDWGWFKIITRPMYNLLSWLHKLFGNFGLAILGITVLAKALFYWPSQKSYESMAKMKKLQPKMEELKVKYPDDKARQQQELMALYQKEKINPLMGCLPMLIQIPVFFALYKVIFIAIDMRHAPFFGWIKDLSAPDPTSFSNLFGLLPIPALEPYLLGYTIGAWALIMGFTMWFQMQLNPQQPDPTQQAIFNWMPVMFTFMLGGFASGLVIYWAWSNILSIAQQYYIMKRLGADVPLVDNLKKTWGAAMGLVKPKGSKEKV